MGNGRGAGAERHGSRAGARATRSSGGKQQEQRWQAAAAAASSSSSGRGGRLSYNTAVDPPFQPSAFKRGLFRCGAPWGVRNDSPESPRILYRLWSLRLPRHENSPNQWRCDPFFSQQKRPKKRPESPPRAPCRSQRAGGGTRGDNARGRGAAAATRKRLGARETALSPAPK